MTAIPEACICWSCLLLLQRKAGLADVEIIARVERRRKWTAQEKAALLAEVKAEGGKVTIVAQRHRIAESVLDNWRAAWKAAAAMMPAPTAPTFIPLGMLGGSDHREPAMQAPRSRSRQSRCGPCRPATGALVRSRSCCRTMPASAWTLL